MLDTLPSPADTPAPASYHWTPTLQAEFLGHLAATGSVKLAASHVGMSPRAAHDLRHRRDGLAMRIGWAAAVLIARARLEDALLDRALFGTEEIWERRAIGDDGAQQVVRRRHHVQTGLAMLARLDRMAEVRAATLDARLAQLAASDWASFLSLFADPDFATGMERLVEQWFTRRIAMADRLEQIVGLPAIKSEVAQISAADAAPGAAATKDDINVAAAAPRPKVWADTDGNWMTNFPPPPGFDGYESGHFGSGEYQRTLSEEELAKIEKQMAREVEAAETERNAFFELEG